MGRGRRRRGGQGARARGSGARAQAARVRAALQLDLRRRPHRGGRRYGREGRVVVRQRVGLLEPPRRPRAAGARAGPRLIHAPLVDAPGDARPDGSRAQTVEPLTRRLGVGTELVVPRNLLQMLYPRVHMAKLRRPERAAIRAFPELRSVVTTAPADTAPDHSYTSARTGSSRAARRAGSTAASTPSTTAATPTTAIAVTGKWNVMPGRIEPSPRTHM